MADFSHGPQQHPQLPSVLGLQADFATRFDNQHFLGQVVLRLPECVTEVPGAAVVISSCGDETLKRRAPFVLDKPFHSLEELARQAKAVPDIAFDVAHAVIESRGQTKLLHALFALMLVTGGRQEFLVPTRDGSDCWKSPHPAAVRAIVNAEEKHPVAVWRECLSPEAFNAHLSAFMGRIRDGRLLAGPCRDALLDYLSANSYGDESFKGDFTVNADIKGRILLPHETLSSIVLHHQSRTYHLHFTLMSDGSVDCARGVS